MRILFLCCLLFAICQAATVRVSLIVSYTTWNNRTSITFNGTIPGPRIDCIKGDHLEITVINHLTDRPTSVHPHGFYQTLTPEADGVAGLSQCPIPPGQQHTYKFLADPSGTSWLHGHYHTQMEDGLYLPIVVAEPG